MSALRAVELTARYAGQPASSAALIDINLAVEDGERLLLVGPNGAGKSTFIRVFSGLMRAEHGQALIEGRLARESRGNVGVVGHATYLYDELSVRENLRFYSELYGVDDDRRVGRLLGSLEIQHLADIQVGHLSRGQQQRVSIARALVHDPPVLLLDEPDTGLDTIALDLLVRLLVQDARTVVLTTHNLATGLRLATQVGVLARGRLVHELSAASAIDPALLTNLLDSLP